MNKDSDHYHWCNSDTSITKATNKQLSDWTQSLLYEIDTINRVKS